jgi:RNA-binding protein
LSAHQKRYLRAFVHALNPVTLVGQKGVTPALLKELDGALDHHELVKVKLADNDRESRAESIEQIRASSGAEIVQTIGHVACLYRRHPREPKFDLPK